MDPQYLRDLAAWTQKGRIVQQLRPTERARFDFEILIDAFVAHQATYATQEGTDEALEETPGCCQFWVALRRFFLEQ